MFMRNAWYVAASETELGEELLAVKLLNGEIAAGQTVKVTAENGELIFSPTEGEKAAGQN